MSSMPHRHTGLHGDVDSLLIAPHVLGSYLPEKVTDPPQIAVSKDQAQRQLPLSAGSTSAPGAWGQGLSTGLG